MASRTRIVPEHDYAHVMIVEHDNSQRPNDRDAAVLQTYCDMMFVFASPKGIDDKLQTITTGLKGFDEAYGVGSFDDYGQPYLNARNAAASNAATLHCLRVTADDATYAGGALVAHYRVTGNQKPEEPEPEPLPAEGIDNMGHEDVVISMDPIDEEAPNNYVIRIAGTDVTPGISEQNKLLFQDLDGDYIDIAIKFQDIMELNAEKDYVVTQVNPALKQWVGKDEYITESAGAYVKKRVYSGSELMEGYAFLVGADTSAIAIAICEWGETAPAAASRTILLKAAVNNNTDLGVTFADDKAKATVTYDTAAKEYVITTTGEVLDGSEMHPELWGGDQSVNKHAEIQIIFPNLEESTEYTVTQKNPYLRHWSSDSRITNQGTVWTKVSECTGKDLLDGFCLLLGEMEDAEITLAEKDTSETLCTVKIVNEFEYVEERTVVEYGPIGDATNVTFHTSVAFKNAATSEVLRATAGLNRIMRIATNAAKAVALADEVETTPVEEPKMEIYYTFEPLDRQMSNEDDLGTLFDPLDPTPDEDGFRSVVLMEISARGRGSFGNNLRFVINNYTRGDKMSAYKNYTFTLYEINKATLTQKETYTISFRPDAVSSSGETLYLDYLVGDPYQNSQYFRTWINRGAFPLLYAMYLSVVPDTALTADTFDPITGTMFATSAGKIPNLEILTDVQGAISLTGASGVPFRGGSDGAFALGAVGREDAMQRAYLKAWSGEVDEMIFSRKMYPTDIVLDAQFPVETKMAISELTRKRKDHMTFYDLGTSFNTFAGLMEELAEIEVFVSTRDEAIEAYYGKIQDPSTFKLVKVSSTYPLAFMYPNHFREHGAKHVPMAGSSFGVMSTFIKGSAYPVFDDDIHSAEMDKLAEMHVNYLKVNTLKQIVRGAQDTRQSADTNLSECSNVFILHDIRRDAVKLCEQYEYNFAESSDLQRFNKAAGILADKYAAAQVSSITATFEMTDWEAERGILHLYIEFVHKRIIKRAIVEIDINRGQVVV